MTSLLSTALLPGGLLHVAMGLIVLHTDSGHYAGQYRWHSRHAGLRTRLRQLRPGPGQIATHCRESDLPPQHSLAFW